MLVTGSKLAVIAKYEGAWQTNRQQTIPHIYIHTAQVETSQMTWLMTIMIVSLATIK